MPGSTSTAKVRTLVQTWLLLDFFGEARRTGAQASTLTTTIFSQSFLAFVVAALLYPEPPPVPFAAANLCLSTLLVALGALDGERPASRRQADMLLLGTAPLGRFTTTVARALHAACQTMLLTIGMALPPAILLACRQHAFWLFPGYLLAACACTALVLGSFAVLQRASQRWLGPSRTALLVGTLKAVLVGAGVVLFVLGLQVLRKDADALPIGRLGAEMLPPYQCAKMLAAPGAEAWRLLPMLAFGCGLALAATMLGETERQGRPAVIRAGLLARLAAATSRRQGERAITMFTAAMLWRSPGLRARVLPLLGMPAAIAFLALRSGDARSREMFLSMALQFPAIYLPLVVAFLPRGDQPGASWVFDSAPLLSQPQVQRSVWVALVTHVLMPVHMLSAAILVMVGEPLVDVLGAVSFAAGIAFLAARAMVRQLQTLPFTQHADTAAIDLGNILAGAIALAGAGVAFTLAPLPLQLGMGAATLALALLWMRPHR